MPAAEVVAAEVARRRGGPWDEEVSAVAVLRRRAARVLLLDRDDRVLLLRGLDPAVPETIWWITPGGGLEPGESVREAALRELAEELGSADVELGPVVAYGTVSFSFQGQDYEQEQWFHLARTVAEPDSFGLVGVDGAAGVSAGGAGGFTGTVGAGGGAGGSAGTAGVGGEEHARLLAARWWTVQELRDTAETVYPAGLAELVEQLVTDGPPVPPVRL
nr:NUDIX domain-containing protein [Streptomyces sp. TLI_235]